MKRTRDRDLPRCLGPRRPVPPVQVIDKDVHDRRPVVLSAADAALRLDPDLPAEQAEQLLRSVAIGAEAFEYFAVDRAMGNVRHQGSQVAMPVEVAANA